MDLGNYERQSNNGHTQQGVNGQINKKLNSGLKQPGVWAYSLFFLSLHIYLGDDHLRIQARETFPAHPHLALLYLSQLLHYLADSRDEATPPPTHLPHQDPPHQPNRRHIANHH